jgi:hypothetical protein
MRKGVLSDGEAKGMLQKLIHSRAFTLVAFTVRTSSPR